MSTSPNDSPTDNPINSPIDSPENSPTPEAPIYPVNKQALSMAGKAGAILGVVAILLFVGFWLVLGALGAEQIPRLLLSLCVPPGLIGAGILIYARVARPTL